MQRLTGLLAASLLFSLGACRGAEPLPAMPPVAAPEPAETPSELETVPPTDVDPATNPERPLDTAPVPSAAPAPAPGATPDEPGTSQGGALTSPGTQGTPPVTQAAPAPTAYAYAQRDQMTHDANARITEIDRQLGALEADPMTKDQARTLREQRDLIVQRLGQSGAQTESSWADFRNQLQRDLDQLQRDAQQR
jgi:hypothetical protein